MILLLFCLNICVFNFERESSGIFTKNMTTAAKLLQSCLTLCDPIDHSAQGKIHNINVEEYRDC